MQERISVSVKQASEMTGISVTGIYRLFKSGSLTKKKVGGKTLILMAEIHSLLSTDKQAA